MACMTIEQGGTFEMSCFTANNYLSECGNFYQQILSKRKFPPPQHVYYLIQPKSKPTKKHLNKRPIMYSRTLWALTTSSASSSSCPGIQNRTGNEGAKGKRSLHQRNSWLLWGTCTLYMVLTHENKALPTCTLWSPKKVSIRVSYEYLLQMDVCTLDASRKSIQKRNP